MTLTYIPCEVEVVSSLGQDPGVKTSHDVILSHQILQNIGPVCYLVL